MVYKVSDLFRRISTILNDDDAVRWPYPERLDWLNDGAIRICSAKPNANVNPLTITLTPAGSRYALAKGTGLVRILDAVAAGVVYAPTIISPQLIAAFNPAWQSMTPQARVDHVIYDPAMPDVLFVYPPNDGTGILHVEVTKAPTPLDPPVPDDDIAAYSMALPLGDDYMGPLLDYCLYRAYAKDASQPNALTRSQAHFQAFQIAIGEKTQRDLVANPTTTHALPNT